MNAVMVFVIAAAIALLTGGSEWLLLIAVAYLLFANADLRKRLDKLEQGQRAPQMPPAKPVKPLRKHYRIKKTDTPADIQAAAPEAEASLPAPTAPATSATMLQAAAPIPVPTAPAASETNPLWTWFWRGNPLLKTGMALLFLGLAFLLRLTAEYVHFPIEARYAGVAATGAAAVWAGGRLARRRRTYGLAVQGFGMAVLYLTVLAALKLHHLLPAPAALVLLTLVVAAMTALAVKRDAPVLAQIAAAGGVAAPVLVSDGGGSHVVLFAYLALLNTGIAATAWFKSWRSLNLIGFAGTFLIGAVWGAQAYTHRHFATTEPFLLYHALLYTWVVWRFACRPDRKPAPELDNDADWRTLLRHAAQYGMGIGRVDGALLCGTAVAAFSLQYRMVAAVPYGAAWSALGFAAAYALAAWLARRHSGSLKTAFAVLAAGFATLSIPLAFNVSWTAAAWTLEAALVYGFGTRLRQPWLRLGALAVGTAAALLHFTSYSWPFFFIKPTFLEGDVGGTLWTVAGGAAVWAWRRNDAPARWERIGRGVVLLLTGWHAMLLPLIALPFAWALPVSACYLPAWAWRRNKWGRAAEGLLGIGLLLCLWSIMFSRQPYSVLAAAVPIAAAAYLLQKQRCGEITAWAAVVLSCASGMSALHDKLPETAWAAVLWFAAWGVAAARLNWQQGLRTALVFPLAFVMLWAGTPHSLPVLIAATLLHGLLLRAQNISLNAEIHGFGLLLFAALWTAFAMEMSRGSAWAVAATGVLPCAGVYLFGRYGTRLAQCLRDRHDTYSVWGTAAAAFGCGLWLPYANTVAPAAPLPYLPLLNPVFVLGALMCWGVLRHTRLPQWAAGAGLWYVLSAEVLRNGHFFGGVAWRLQDLLASFALQAALSVVWTAMGIALMVWGHRSARRLRWQAGAALLGVVVAKLFFVELSDSGGVARIVSFIAVGLMMVAVGWFAPVPPQDNQEK